MVDAGITAIFSESDRAALDDLWRVYDGHAAAISDEIIPKLASEPALGAVLSSDSEQGRKHCAAFLSSWTSKGGQDRALADAELERCQDFFTKRLVEAQGGSVGVKTSDDHEHLRQLAHGVVEKNSWRPSAFLDEIRGLIAGPGSLQPKSEVA